MEENEKALDSSIVKNKKTKRIWHRIALVLSCITVFITCYLLMAPAITIDTDKAAICGMEEHVHGEACYKDGALICSQPEHRHDTSCFVRPSVNGTFDCGFTYEHEHGEECYVDGTLICTLPEHTHTSHCLSADYLAKPRMMSGGASNETVFSSDLADFLYSYQLLDINGNEIPADGTVYVGQRYKIKLQFAEVDAVTGSIQFAENTSHELTYQFDTTFLTITAVDWNDLYVHNSVTNTDVKVGRFKINDQGKLIVKYDDTNNEGEDTTGTHYFDWYLNTTLGVEFSVIVDDNDGDGNLKIDLDSTVSIQVNAPKEADLNVSKTHSTFAENTHSLHYTVRVECDHGVVSDLSFADVATVKDRKADITYGLSDGMFSYRNMEITDLHGNPVLDGSGNPITDIASLTALSPELRGGEGFLIDYDIKLDSDLYDQYALYDILHNNTFTAGGKDLNDNPIEKTVTDTCNYQRTNFTKSGATQGTVTVGGTEYTRIVWTVYAGDLENTIDTDVSFTDILNGEGHHFDTSFTPTWQIEAPDSARAIGNLAWGTTAVLGTGSDVSATFTLPEGGSKYKLVYATYVENPGTYSNVVSTPNTPEGANWSSTSSVTAISSVPVIDKVVSGSDGEYVYFTTTCEIPGAQYHKRVYIRDTLGGSNGLYFTNVPEDLVVTVTDHATGDVITLSPYDGTTYTDTYRLFLYNEIGDRNRFVIEFSDSAYGNSFVGSWPYEHDTTLTISYKVSRDTPKAIANPGRDDPTLGSELEHSRKIFNTAEITYNGDWSTELARVYYNEMAPVAKKGSVKSPKNGIMTYKAVFTNDRLIDANTKTALLQSGISDAYFLDDFDDRLEYVDGSLYALIYTRTTSAEKSLSSDYGESSPLFGVFKYTGSAPTGSEINAAWTDFTPFDYSGQFPVADVNKFRYESGQVRSQGTWYSNMETFMEDNPASFGIVFIYDTQVKTEYRETLAATESVMTLLNTANVGWTLPGGASYVSEEATAKVIYDTKLLEKTSTQLGEGSDVIRYEVTANPYGYSLTETGFYTLSDTMCDDLMLYQASVELKVGTIQPDDSILWTTYDGDPNIRYDEAAHRLTATVPDGRPVRLIYECKVTATGNVELSNSVQIEGFNKVVNSNNAVFDVLGSGSSSGGSTSYLYLKKYDSDTHEALNDAWFALYGSNPTKAGDAAAAGVDATITVHGDTLYFYKKYKTDVNANPALNGTFVLDNNADELEKYGHYALVEVTPPAGYTLNNSKFDFYWLDYPASPIADVPLYEDGFTVNVTDSLITYALPATGGEGTYAYVAAGASIMALCVLGGVGLILIERRKASRRK